MIVQLAYGMDQQQQLLSQMRCWQHPHQFLGEQEVAVYSLQCPPALMLLLLQSTTMLVQLLLLQQEMSVSFPGSNG
jgi:uncharacterized membrane protein